MRSLNLTPPRPRNREPRAAGTRTSRAAQVREIELPSWRTLRNVALGLGMLVAGGTFVGAPYKAADRLGAALERGDADTIAELVDFPALREDLKKQVRATFEVRDDGTDSTLAMAGAAAANTAIDNVVQPEVIAKLREAPVSADVRKRMESALRRARGSYESPLTFEVRAVLVDVSDEPVRVKLSRTGLLSWRVKSVTLPKDLSRIEELAKSMQAQPEAGLPADALVRAQ